MLIGACVWKNRKAAWWSETKTHLGQRLTKVNPYWPTWSWKPQVFAAVAQARRLWLVCVVLDLLSDAHPFNALWPVTWAKFVISSKQNAWAETNMYKMWKYMWVPYVFIRIFIRIYISYISFIHWKISMTEIVRTCQDTNLVIPSHCSL
jgi:hypothetical protein